ncbi:hypothetical protein E4U25_006067 [Claviceps purpurea]|nr:hypothetical protein E4U25_006067 [Claviceps purpurea]
MAIFLEASRINYDCASNAEEDWNSNIKRHTVHAMRDIHVGEEITLPYACLPSTRTTRQWFFQKQHGFVCLCQTCALPYTQKEERERKLFQIASLRQVYEDTVSLCPPIRSLQHLEAQVRIYNELNREELVLAMVYKLAAFLVISHGDLARGRVFAQKGESICKTLLGSDNPMTIKFTNLARDPSRYQKYGQSMRWKLPVDQIPHELGPHDFENWLWSREEPIDPPAKALIPPKQSFFSGFVDLPNKDDIGTNSSFKKRHWCFLGQVMEPILVVPLDLQVMDVHGKRLRVHFYTPQMGMYELSPQQADRGHTLAILDARKYDFKFGPPGVLLQDVRMLKDCQMVGWVTKAHKACCKFLKDPDLRSLLLTEWDGVQDSVSFPLKVADGFC